MKKKKHPKVLYEIIYAGKSLFCLTHTPDHIEVYRAYRKHWAYVGVCDTLSGAKSRILDELIVKRLDVENSLEWLKARRK